MSIPSNHSIHERAAVLKQILVSPVSEIPVYELCCIISNDPSEACVELAFACALNLVEDAVEVDNSNLECILEAIRVRVLALRNSDHVTLCMAQLVDKISKKVPHIPCEVIQSFLKSDCVEVVLNGLQIEARCHLIPLERMDLILNLLTHKYHRIRKQAIVTVDESLMRRQPWKSTFLIISRMAALSSNEIPVAEIFNPTTKVNYMSSLTFDSNIGVRRAWFQQLVLWTTTLEDRADVESHFFPYLMTGLFDPALAAEVRQWVEPQYVRRCARRFMPAFMKNVECDFSHTTRKNALNMLAVLIENMDEQMLIEWTVSVLRLCLKTKVCESGLTDRVLKALGENVRADIWYDLVPGDPSGDDYWWLINQLFLSSECPVSETVREYFIAKLAEVRFPTPSMSHVFSRIQSDSVDSVWVALILGMPGALTVDRPGMVKLTNKFCERKHDVTGGMVVRLLDLISGSQAGESLLPNIVEIIVEMEFFEDKVFDAVYTVSPEVVCDMLCEMLGKDPVDSTVYRSIARIFANKTNEGIVRKLIDKLLTCEWSVKVLVCLTFASPFMKRAEINEVLLKASRSKSKSKPLFKLGLAMFTLSALESSSSLELENVIEELVPATLDHQVIPETMCEPIDPIDLLEDIDHSHERIRAQFCAMVDDIMTIAAQQFPQEFLRLRLNSEQSGFIARAVYLSKFICF